MRHPFSWFLAMNLIDLESIPWLNLNDKPGYSVRFEGYILSGSLRTIRIQLIFIPMV
jgi:hypothetical protein